ncbi:hypothetical protein FNT36_24145 [Hymenobacter setariae]|jgi:hypothetical protein|uniref:Competence protein n=1 Tax=Hymenobacter setariae TaxID=2594794 RepID=A0A558BKB8_9BACT|nr:hypothetical protein [Hymenobacter setariae]TVT36962.1 hypothetical protein FNT36_24145 [Hymenobacter setariae]
MAARIKFAFAHDAQGKVVRADEADKLCQAYTCRGCDKPVILCYGDINQTRHFRHKVRTLEEHCRYQDETHAHRHAKAVLQQRQWVRVPPVVARRAEGYYGPVPILREARTVRAVHVYNERTVYENVACGLDFQREAGKFEAVPGEQRALYRPDVIFTDAEDKLLLLIEIHVTHEVDYKKLVALRRAQVDTIEITIPYFLSAQEIEDLLASHASTAWLYNHERETTDPIGRDAASPPAPGGIYPDEAPADEPESLECQLHEIREAARSLRKFVGGAAMAALRDRFAGAGADLTAAEGREDDAFRAALAGAEAEICASFGEAAAEIEREKAELVAEKTDVARIFESEQARLSGEISAADLALDAAYRAAAPDLRKRVEERRTANRRTIQALTASREQLRRKLEAEKANLDQRFQRAAAELERQAAASSTAIDAATAAEHAAQARIARLSSYLERRSHRAGDALARRIRSLEDETPDIIRRSAELGRFERELATAERLRAELERLEPAVAAAEEALGQRRADHASRVAAREREAELVGAALRRAEAGLAEEVAAATTCLARLTPTYEALRAAKGRAIDRRFSSR